MSKKHYTIDSISDLVKIKKQFGRKLTISNKDYETYQDKIKFRKHFSDTITIQLIPKDSLIQKGYKDLWFKDRSSDTLICENFLCLQNKVLSYLNYLSYFDDHCHGGICNYSNMYVYKFYFNQSDSVFCIDKIEKLQPHSFSYDCEIHNVHLKQLVEIFPKVSLQTNSDNFSLKFIIWI